MLPFLHAFDMRVCIYMIMYIYACTCMFNLAVHACTWDFTAIVGTILIHVSCIFDTGVAGTILDPRSNMAIGDDFITSMPSSAMDAEVRTM